MKNPMALLNAEVELISDTILQVQISQVVNTIASKTWRAPSARNHHLLDEREEWGNLLHTVRVTRMAAVLSEVASLNRRDRDLLRSAAILHDCCKFGLYGEDGYLQYQHPEIVSTLMIELKIQIPNEVIGIIRQHTGKWGRCRLDWTDNRRITLAFLLHVADATVAHLSEVL